MKTRNQRIKAVLRFVFFLSAIVLIGCDTSENSEEPTEDAGVDSYDDMANDMNDASDGVAEDMSHRFVVRIEYVSQAAPYLQSGVFNTPQGDMEPGPAIPGKSYTFSFHSAAGNKLSFATMFVKSNDLFIAPNDQGIELFPNGSALSGDITDSILLWDVGTEVNEYPGTGPSQPLRQAGPDRGDDEDGDVSEVDDGFNYPSVDELVKITIAVE